MPSTIASSSFSGRATKHPRRYFVFVAGMANANPQAMKFRVTEMRHDVAQAVLAAVAAVELQAHGAGIEVQLIVSDQAFFRLDLVVAQRRDDGDATLVHEGGGLEQPYRRASNADLAGLAMQLAVETEALALP